MVMLLTIFGYILLLMLVRHSTSKRSSNDAFYRGERKSPWYVVAWGMIGASISGVTFVSVPGMVLNTQMTYLQTCLGFILGYALVAFVLLPIYYKLNLTTIYSYLSKRLGKKSYHTGASFFLLSKMTGAAARFYVVCIILQRFVLDEWGIPFWITVPVMVRLNVGDRSSSVHIRAGGYYSYQWNRKSFLGEETYRSHQWGLGCGFGVRLGYNWDLSFMALYQVNHLFGGAGLPKAYKNLSSCTLTYYFL